MSITELLPLLKELPKADKLRVIQFLVFELAQDEGINLLVSSQSYPIWSPYNAFDAANTLLNALHEDKADTNV